MQSTTSTHRSLCRAEVARACCVRFAAEAGWSGECNAHNSSRCMSGAGVHCVVRASVLVRAGRKVRKARAKTGGDIIQVDLPGSFMSLCNGCVFTPSWGSCMSLLFTTVGSVQKQVHLHGSQDRHTFHICSEPLAHARIPRYCTDHPTVCLVQKDMLAQAHRYIHEKSVGRCFDSVPGSSQVRSPHVRESWDATLS